MSTASLTPGTLVADHFEVLSRIASDDLVERYLARDLSRRGHVLLHIVHRDASGDGPDMPLKELEEASRLFHPNLASHHGCGRSAQDLLFLVQGYPPGELLADVIETELGAATRRATLTRGVELLDGLAKAHEAGMYHGALDPRSVLIEHLDATRERARILGIGVEQAVRSGQTLERAPAQLRYTDGESTGAAADLFAVGAMLLAMRGGEAALDTWHDRGALPGDVDAGPLGPVLKRALAKDADQRFADADAFARALREVLDTMTSRKAATAASTAGLHTDDPTFDGALSSVVGVTNPGLDGGDVTDASWQELLPDLANDHGHAGSPLAALHEELAMQVEGSREEEPTRISGPPVPEPDHQDTEAHRTAFPDKVSPPPRSLRPSVKSNLPLGNRPDAKATEHEADGEGTPAPSTAKEAPRVEGADAGDAQARPSKTKKTKKKPAFSLSQKLGLKLKKKTSKLKRPEAGDTPSSDADEAETQAGVSESAVTGVVDALSEATGVMDAASDDATVEPAARDAGSADVTRLTPAPTRKESTHVGKPIAAPSDAPDAGSVEQRTSGAPVERVESTQVASRPIVGDGPPPPPRPIARPAAPEGPPPGSSFEMIVEFSELDDEQADDSGVTPLRSPEPIGEVVSVEHAALLPSTVPVERLLARELEPDPAEETTQPRTPRHMVDGAPDGAAPPPLPAMSSVDDEVVDEVEDATTDEAAVTNVRRAVAAATPWWVTYRTQLALGAVAAILLVAVVVVSGGGGETASDAAGDDPPAERAEPDRADDTTQKSDPEASEAVERTAAGAGDDASDDGPALDGPASDPEDSPAGRENAAQTPSDPPVDDALAADDPATVEDGPADGVDVEPTDGDEDETDEEREARRAERKERRERRKRERDAAEAAAKADDNAGGGVLDLKVD